MKIKHNWPVSNNQMSKPISEWDRAFWISVILSAVIIFCMSFFFFLISNNCINKKWEGIRIKKKALESYRYIDDFRIVLVSLYFMKTKLALK